MTAACSEGMWVGSGSRRYDEWEVRGMQEVQRKVFCGFVSHIKSVWFVKQHSCNRVLTGRRTAGSANQEAARSRSQLRPSERRTGDKQTLPIWLQTTRNWERQSDSETDNNNVRLTAASTRPGPEPEPEGEPGSDLGNWSSEWSCVNSGLSAAATKRASEQKQKASNNNDNTEDIEPRYPQCNVFLHVSAFVIPQFYFCPFCRFQSPVCGLMLPPEGFWQIIRLVVS